MVKLFDNKQDLAQFLDEQASYYEKSWFIENDPISIPHRFTKKEDIEIAAFLSATIAWGQRKTILKNAQRIMQMMDHAPHDFISNHKEKDLEPFQGFVHRTFNSTDLLYFIHYLKKLYNHKKSSLEAALSQGENIEQSIHLFKANFFTEEFPKRTQKHVADPKKGSSAKRINMFLRWMVRPNTNGVDFGIWKSWKPKDLMLPLDVHTGNVARKLHLLNRKQNDWKTVEEVTAALRVLDTKDPVKYDFALFGLGVDKRL